MSFHFALEVLGAVRKIPRGKVAAYSDIARLIRKKNASHAIGNALSKNPYPLLVACHRVVRKDRTIGKFQGGASLKKKLLAQEGVTFDENGKIPHRFFI